jgi:hypothetical protein
MHLLTRLCDLSRVLSDSADFFAVGIVCMCVCVCVASPMGIVSRSRSTASEGHVCLLRWGAWDAQRY